MAAMYQVELTGQVLFGDERKTNMTSTICSTEINLGKKMRIKLHIAFNFFFI